MSDIQIEIATPSIDPREEIDLTDGVTSKAKSAKEIKNGTNVTVETPVNPKKV